MNAPVGAVSLMRTAEEKWSRAGVRWRCSLRRWRWPPHMRIRSRTSTSEGRSISLSAPGRAAAYAYARLLPRHLGKFRFLAIRPSLCRTCPERRQPARSQFSSTTSPHEGGTAIGTFTRNMPLIGLLGGNANVRFDPRKLTLARFCHRASSQRRLYSHCAQGRAGEIDR